MWKVSQTCLSEVRGDTSSNARELKSKPDLTRLLLPFLSFLTLPSFLRPPAFPIFSLLQNTYHPLLQILAVNSEHIFHQASREKPDESTTREVVKEFLKERSDDMVGGLDFSVFEDREGVVTDGESTFLSFARFSSRRVEFEFSTSSLPSLTLPLIFPLRHLPSNWSPLHSQRLPVHRLSTVLARRTRTRESEGGWFHLCRRVCHRYRRRSRRSSRLVHQSRRR